MFRRKSHRTRRDGARAPWHADLLVRIGRRLLIVVILAIVAVRWLDIDVETVMPMKECRVSWVIDGDTVTLTCAGGKETRARLVGFDAPEVYSPQCAAEKRAGDAATEALRGAIDGATEIEMRRVGWDRYGRALVRMRLDGDDIAERMISAGHARRDGWGGDEERWCE